LKVLKHLFDNNRKWAASRVQKDPDFFKRLMQQQKPKYLWIGCSDSRVPANQIIGQQPGEVFVHRNIANQVVENDLNCQSVIQFAVDVLKVKHIIVCGHYGCGGIKAAMDNMNIGLADEWINHIKNTEKKFSNVLMKITDGSNRFKALCRLNVLEQVINVCRTNTVRKAWENHQQLSVHGWIYDISDGLLQDLDVCVTNPAEIKSINENTLARLLE
jgi:carbonic anhydrase